MIGSGLCLPHIPRLGTVFGGSTELAQVVPCIGQRLEGLAAHARVADGWQIHDVSLSVLKTTGKRRSSNTGTLLKGPSDGGGRQQYRTAVPSPWCQDVIGSEAASDALRDVAVC